jgi:hypothetical protein
MFGPQGAVTKDAGIAGKKDHRPEPGLAKGGEGEMFGFSGSEKATAGHSAKPSASDASGYRADRQAKQAQDRFGSNDAVAKSAPVGVNTHGASPEFRDGLKKKRG